VKLAEAENNTDEFLTKLKKADMELESE